MSQIDLGLVEQVVEAAIFSSQVPVSVSQLAALFAEEVRPSAASIREVLARLTAVYADRGIELVEVATGYRFQSKATLAPFLHALWEERPTRYSRATLETLALIAYRQPITRAEIEAVRGVAVSTSIIRTLLERDWIRVVGQREVPGKPSLYGTTPHFLADFNLSALDQLPSLAAIETEVFEQADEALAAPGAPDLPVPVCPDEIGATEPDACS